MIQQRQPLPDNRYDFSAPRPYSWKTDEFQTGNDARKTLPTDRVKSSTEQFDRVNQNYRPGHLAANQPQQMNQPFRCPNCMSNFLPQMERRISTAGWITFAVLLVAFFPLFWIGLLIKEDVVVCPSCSSRIS